MCEGGGVRVVGYFLVADVSVSAFVGIHFLSFPTLLTISATKFNYSTHRIDPCSFAQFGIHFLSLLCTQYARQ